jgi:hypothetical protein
MRTQSIDPYISNVFKSIDMKAFEVLCHTLYHTKTLTGAQDGSVSIPSELSYFQIKTGQQDDTGASTTYEDTNMEVAGQIGTPYKFWGQTLHAYVLPAKDSEVPALDIFDKANVKKSYVNDAVKLLGRGVVTINILNQPIARVAPIMAIPSGMGAKANAVFGFDADVASQSVENGVSGVNGYPIDLYLENQISFDFKVNFPGGVFKLYNNLRLGFAIKGFLIRPRQGGGR